MKKILFIVTLMFTGFCSLEASYMLKEDIEQDPCFFRLTTQDARKIYVLGCVHVLNMEDTLSSEALGEFKRIAEEENPILLTEHKISNEDALMILKSGESIEAEEDWAKFVITKEYESFLDEKIMIAPKSVSDLRIGDLLKIKPWLAAPILSTHANLLFYPNFGGTEYNLENDEVWKKCWSDIDYLEGPEHYQLLEKFSTVHLDKDHNIQWIKGSLYKIALMRPLLDISIKEDELEQKVLETEKEVAKIDVQNLLGKAKERYVKTGWTVVNNDLTSIPNSVFARNELWGKTIVEKLSETDKSILIVVGNGHLPGITKDKSFLSYLINESKAEIIERFINSSKTWKSVY